MGYLIPQRDWALTQKKNFLTISAGFLLIFLCNSISPSSFVIWFQLRTFLRDLLLSFFFLHPVWDWICNGCKRECKMRIERPQSSLFWSTAHVDICISELYCTNQTVPRFEGIAAMIFSMGPLSITKLSYQCFCVMAQLSHQCFCITAHNLWAMVRKDKVSNMHEFLSLVQLGIMHKTKVQFFIVNLVKVHTHKKRVREGSWPKNAEQQTKLCFWYVGKTGSLKTFSEAEISRLSNSLTFPDNCSSLPFILSLIAKAGFLVIEWLGWNN